MSSAITSGSSVPSPSARQSSPVSTAKTPGLCSAVALSMARIRAWACDEKTKTACAWRARSMSATYRARPVRKRASSLRVTGCPMPKRMMPPLFSSPLPLRRPYYRSPSPRRRRGSGGSAETWTTGFPLSRERRRKFTASRVLVSQPQIEFPHQFVVVELLGRAALEGDLTVDDDIAAVGDADRLVEVLLGHQHGELVALLQLLDLFDRALDEHWRQAD